MLRKLYISGLALVSFLSHATGQGVPPESSSARITQGLGWQEITISYSRPNVNGRKIWGSLVPYHEVWRTGANYPTFITLEDTTLIEGTHALPPAKYALYTIPTEKEWTIIFSRDTMLWGAYGYKDSADALRVKVKPETGTFHETFTIDFADTKDDAATLLLQWENIKVPVRLSVDIEEKVLASVKAQIAAAKTRSEKYSAYYGGAVYLLKHNIHLDLAHTWIDSSLALGADYFNLWTKAQLLAAQQNYKEALTYGNRAVEAGSKYPQYFNNKQYYLDEIALWQQKAKGH